MQFSLTFNDIPTDAVANTVKTMALLIAPDVAGNRFRLRSLTVGFSEDTPDDQPIAIAIKRIADRSAGTAGTAGATVTGANMPKKDPGSINSLITGATDFSVEPTSYATENIWSDDINDRGSVIKEWDEENAPKFTQDMACGLLAAPRQSIASRVTGTLEFELY